MEFPPDNPGGLVGGMGDSRGELFSKSYCYFNIVGEGFVGKGDGLVGGAFGTFPIKGFDHAPQA